MLESGVEGSSLAEPVVSYLQTRSLLAQYPQLGNRLSQPFFRALQVLQTCGARFLSGEAIAKSADARLEFMVPSPSGAVVLPHTGLGAFAVICHKAHNEGVGGRCYLESVKDNSGFDFNTEGRDHAGRHYQYIHTRFGYVDADC